MKQRLKIAIACPGIGLVQRGFERLLNDMFALVRDEFDVILYKGGGATSDQEKVLTFAHRNGPLPKIFPIHKLFGRTPMHSECMTFVLAMLPHLFKEKFDVIHCIDPPLTRVLFHLRNILKLKFKILYTEGCAMPPGDYPPADHLHQIAKVTYDQAIQFGKSEEFMTLLPCGIYPERFETEKSREELRKEHGLSQDTFVILSVAALNRNHKRIDHLIEEVARLDGDYLLWLDGSLDHGDSGLVDFAKQRLGDRCRITHVPSEKVGELFKCADMMAHASLFEAFGLAIVEGAASGLPVITHNAPHFQWLLPDPEAWVDMDKRGALADRISCLSSNPEALAGLIRPEDVQKMFNWVNLKDQYIELYNKVARLPRLHEPW